MVCRHYHASLSAEEREEVQAAWSSNRVQVCPRNTVRCIVDRTSWVSSIVRRFSGTRVLRAVVLADSALPQQPFVPYVTAVALCSMFPRDVDGNLHPILTLDLLQRC